MSPSSTRTGCDLQQVDDVAVAVDRFGSRYLDRVYTPVEQEAGRVGGPASLAARFAAKEAVLKLIGTADGVDPRNIEIGADPAHPGRPLVRLSGLAAELAAAEGIGPIDVSLSHTAGFAMAVAVAGTTSSHTISHTVSTVTPTQEEAPLR